MYNISVKSIITKDSFKSIYIFDDIEYPKNKCLVVPNVKLTSDYIIKYCPSCGKHFVGQDEFLLKKGYCPCCHFNFNSLDFFNPTVSNPILLLSNSIEINLGGIFVENALQTYTIDKLYYPLLEQMYNLFGSAGILGLICWLKGRLPRVEVCKTLRTIIQVLLYLKKLTGVYFNPVTRES